MLKQNILAFDGHDASGKTTLAQLLAGQLGGIYVKPYDGKLGDMIAWQWKRQHFDFANKLALAAVEKIREEHVNAPLLIFDRYWLTMFTVLPEIYFANWQPRVDTIVCWADIKTTSKRLKERGEPVGKVEKHLRYCKLYRELAGRFQVPVIDTSKLGIEECISIIFTLPNIKALRESL